MTVVAQRSVTLNVLEDGQQNGVVKATPGSFKTNQQKWIHVVRGQELLLNDEVAASEALRNQDQHNSSRGCLRLARGRALAFRHPNVADRGNTSHNHAERNKVVQVLLALKEDHAQDSSDQDNRTPHHLINRGSGLSQSNHQ